MARLVVKNRHNKDSCHNKIGLCAQILDIILSSIDHDSYNYKSTNKKKKRTTKNQKLTHLEGPM